MAEKVGNASGAIDCPADDPAKGLEVLDSDWEEMDLGDGGDVIVVGPMKMGQIRAFMKEATVLLPAIGKAFRGAHQQGGIEIDVQEVMDIDQDAFYKAIAIAGGISMERLDGLMPDAFARLVAKVFAANLDFFAQKLPSVLEQAAVRVGGAWKRLNAAGTTPSSV